MLSDQKNRYLFYLLGGLFLLGGIYFFYHSRSSQPTAIQFILKDQPTLGYIDAPVQVVIFEEPICSACRNFTLKIFPELKKEFIDTNLIQYSLIPVSFLPNSMPIAIAWLCFLQQNQQDETNQKFFDYVYQTYIDQEKKAISSLDLIKHPLYTEILEACQDSKQYIKKIKKNTAYGNKIMKGELSTPALYIEGIYIEDLDYKNIAKIIKKELAKKDTLLSKKVIN